MPSILISLEPPLTRVLGFPAEGTPAGVAVINSAVTALRIPGVHIHARSPHLTYSGSGRNTNISSVCCFECVYVSLDIQPVILDTFATIVRQLEKQKTAIERALKALRRGRQQPGAFRAGGRFHQT